MSSLIKTTKYQISNKSFIVPAIFGFLFSTAVTASLWAKQTMGKLELLSLWVGLLVIAALGLFLLSKLNFVISNGGGQRFLKYDCLV